MLDLQLSSTSSEMHRGGSYSSAADLTNWEVTSWQDLLSVITV